MKFHCKRNKNSTLRRQTDFLNQHIWPTSKALFTQWHPLCLQQYKALSIKICEEWVWFSVNLCFLKILKEDQGNVLRFKIKQIAFCLPARPLKVSPELVLLVPKHSNEMQMMFCKQRQLILLGVMLKIYCQEIFLQTSCRVHRWTSWYKQGRCFQLLSSSSMLTGTGLAHSLSYNGELIW